MQKENKKRIWQMVKTALGILCVGALFCLALVFPRYYYQHYDNSTLNQVTFTDIDVRTYETSYDSFIEKLHALARVFSDHEDLLQAVQVNELGSEMSRSELTKIANRELKKLKECNEIDDNMSFKKKNLILHERYVVYQASQKDNFKGISIWKLVYENKKRKLTLYLDEEYHKIYYLRHESKEVTKDTTVAYQKGYDDSSNWWDTMIQYYGFSYQNESIYFNVPQEYERSGDIVFEDKYSIVLFCYQSFDENGRYILKMGIPMDKMIQL